MTRILLFLFLPICTVVFGQNSDTITVFFDFDSSIPKFGDQKILSKVEKLDINTKLIIKGYTDTTGSLDYNKVLAEQRVKSVRSHINLPDSLITEEILGETNDFGSDEQNRRVLIVHRTSVLNEAKVLDTLVLGIQFVNRRDVILEKSYPELRKLIETVKRGGFGKIEVHGHVCCTGNYQLSYDRAKTVERELIKAGVDPEKIVCIGHSNEQPRYPENNAENEAKNRRVEVVLRE